MIKIRYPRLVKFKKKNKNLILFAKLSAIFYISIGTLSYLNTNTEAYLNVNKKANIVLESGYWEETKDIWNPESLDFLNINNQIINSCEPIEIFTIIKNSSTSDMTGNLQYEVFYTSSGNPVEGVKEAEGKIDMLKANQTAKLSYIASKSGIYQFKTLQIPDNNNVFSNGHDLWSGTIQVKCNQNILNDSEDLKTNQKDGEGKAIAEPSKKDSRGEAIAEPSKEDSDGDTNVETSQEVGKDNPLLETPEEE
ncbi:amyloid fiber anchoring/assembly protein TapA [Neobacillus drentensis]|uniref:amyloid fiber anchoring/assembly protein TapA n=1 Tax=Neobacillus drentensis TaxID=220684 RepID=UPI003000F8E9